MRISDKYQWRQLSSDDGHYFFGYYDRNPWNEDNSFHLALKVQQCSRLPLAGEKADIGYIEKSSGKFIPCAQTRAWCHQQGAMQQWLKHIPNAFIYNDFDVEKKRLVSKIYQIDKGIIGQYDRPVYVLSNDGKFGISLNFSRIPRRGYSYADVPIPENYHPDIDNDGIILINMQTGKHKLLVSYRQIIKEYSMQFELNDKYWWLNHPGFNIDSSKILFLFRHCDDPLQPSSWSTNMYTVGLDGSGLKCILPQVYWEDRISHQLWGRTSNEILLDARWRNESSEYVTISDRSDFKTKLISKGMGPMGHLIFSNSGSHLLADTYPQKETQFLSKVNSQSGSVEIIGKFKHSQPPAFPVDVRCDLHPRWSNDDSIISVDSIHSGKRQIYILENH